MSASDSTLTGADFRVMAAAAARAVNDRKGELSRLDAAGGDGDHGANVNAGLAEAGSLIEALTEPTPADVLGALTVACQEHMAGAGGLLLGGFFAGAKDAIGQATQVDSVTLSLALRAGLERLQSLGKASVGDRTMVDALAPAVEAASKAAAGRAKPAEVLKDAAAASHRGARSTSSLTPKHGRARYAPGRAVGTPDAGATTVALILSAWSESFTEDGEA